MCFRNLGILIKLYIVFMMVIMMPGYPSRETEIPYEKISETSRFGNNIAEIIKSVCIEKYDTFRSLDYYCFIRPILYYL